VEWDGVAVVAAWGCDSALDDAGTLVGVVGGAVYCLLLSELEWVPRMGRGFLSRIDRRGRGGDEEPGLPFPG